MHIAPRFAAVVLAFTLSLTCTCASAQTASNNPMDGVGVERVRREA